MREGSMNSAYEAGGYCKQICACLPKRSRAAAELVNATTSEIASTSNVSILRDAAMCGRRP